MLVLVWVFSCLYLCFHVCYVRLKHDFFFLSGGGFSLNSTSSLIAFLLCTTMQALGSMLKILVFAGLPDVLFPPATAVLSRGCIGM